jgi:hypothetical protein
MGDLYLDPSGIKLDKKTGEVTQIALVDNEFPAPTGHRYVIHLPVFRDLGGSVTAGEPLARVSAVLVGEMEV